MQATINKLTLDKKIIQDLVIDRENELKMLNDPRHLKDLKSMMNDMEANLQIIGKEKEIQYTEMQYLMGVLGSFKPNI